MADTVKSWIEERRAALAHVLKHPHPDPAAEWAQAALDALNAVLELHEPVSSEFSDNQWCGTCRDEGGDLMSYPCPTVQAIEGELTND